MRVSSEKGYLLVGGLGNLVLIEWNVADDAANSDGLRLVAQSESAQGGAVAHLLHGDRSGHADAHQALCEAARELGHVLFDLIASGRVFLESPLDVFDENFVSPGVDVHHALGSLRENRFEKFEELEFGFDDLSSLHWGVSGAEHITLENLFLVKVANFHLDVVAWSCIHNRLLLVVYETEDLAGQAVRCKGKSVSDAHSSLLDLTKNHCLVAVLHFVKNWDSQRRLRVSCLNRHLIKDIDQRGALVPVANAAVNWLYNVLTGKTGNWDPVEVRFLETAVLQERCEVGFNFVISGLFPRHCCFVHFIDNNNELRDSERASKLNVLSGLAFLFKSSFKFTTSCRDDQTSKIG